tara:strand:- start:205 stop:609 length:405 start_codon:yes stop_codon:yes gene_type:complete
MNKVISYFLISILSLFFLIEIANLIGFGSQEIYLKHPDYPEGEQFKKDLRAGHVKLILWSLLTFSLLISTIVAKVNKRYDWISKIAFIFCLLTNYLPYLSFINGKTTNGIIQISITMTLTVLMFFKLKKETVHE